MPVQARTHTHGLLVVQTEDKWLHRTGYLQGYKQASVAGQLRVMPVVRATMNRIDAGFAPLTGPVAEPWADRHDPASLAARVLQGVVALQRAAGLAVSPQFWLDGGVPLPGGGLRYNVTAPAPHADAWNLLLMLVLNTINRLAAGAAGDGGLQEGFQHHRARLARLSGSGQNTPYLLAAALELGVPVRSIGKQTLRLGWGARQRLFASTLSDRTPALGAALARDKAATAHMLRSLGLPGGINRVVDNADEAVTFARRLGFPVVVKPAYLDGGVGVAADLADEAAVRLAHAAAARLSPAVLVEKHVVGIGHRLTVAHGRVVKASAKLPWGVTGDGQCSIEALVQADAQARAAKLAADHRSAQHRLPPSTWSLDDEAQGMLAQYGLSLNSVPEVGHFVALRRRNNAVAGGSTQRLELDAVHPDNLELAVRAAAALMLDLAGVDLIAPDIGRSWREQQVLICEVNAQPQTDAKTMALILREALAGSDCRIPVWLLLLGSAAAAPTAAQTAELMQRLQADGLGSAAGVWLGAKHASALPPHAWAAAEAVLAAREVSRALLVLTLSDVHQHGLPADRLAGVFAAPDAQTLLQQVQHATPRQTGAPAKPAAGTWAIGEGWSNADIGSLRTLLPLIQPHLMPAATSGG